MATTPKYDNDYVTLGYLNKTLGAESEETKTEINKIPKNYNSPPVPPYYENSLLLLNGQIYKCIKSRLVGSFNISDWKIVVSTNELDEALRFIYDVNKLEYVDQEDGVIETFYQEEDPSLNWETDIEKNKHVSDLWTIDNSICYQYEKKATNPVTYGWKRVSIPTSLFDIVDGYRKIFTEEPTNYSKDDLWLGEITKIAIESSETFDSSHWEDRDDFIESSITEQEEYHKVYLLPKITEINRQTQSEIRKAVDEIVLRVSQTYTTKTEVEQYIDDIKTGVAEEYTTKEEFNAQLSLTSTQINAIVEKNTQQDGNIETLNQEYSSLKITSDGIKTQVSSIESEIESTNENVNSLQTEIQGVNANFNEFKDNEYINSINNLQDQIDGAIQFWNGPEIPTIENYPANEWITENEKINHQADIYTVIQDVEGEMKQGKSYRFDKINGVWQWIELTDNELSAVQAIAQDALNKSNQNTTDIETLNKKTSELEQTDSEIRASVTTLNNKYEKDITLTKQASGNSITIEDAGAYPCENFIVEGKSEQETSVQGKNYYTGNKFTNGTGLGITYDFDNSIIKLNGTTTGSGTFYEASTKIKVPAGTYSYALGLKSGTFTTNDKDIAIYLRSATDFITGAYGTSGHTLKSIQNSTIKRPRRSFTIEQEVELYVRLYTNGSGVVCENVELELQLEQGDTSTDFEQFIPNSPSPDYPSEIKTVKGIENLFDYENEDNYIKFENVSMTKIDNGIRIQQNVAGTYKFGGYILNTDELLGKAFTLSCKYNANSSNTPKIFVYWWNGSTLPTENKITTLNGNGGTFTIPTEAKTDKIIILFYSNFDGTGNANDYVDYTNILLEEGSIIHDFVPYGSKCLINRITGKNKLYLNNVSGTKNGIEYTWNGTELILNGTATAQTDIYNFGSWGATTKNEKRLLKAGIYALSIQGSSNVNRFSLNAYYDVTPVITRYNTASITTRTLTDDMYYSNCYITIVNGATFNNEKFYFQLEKGGVATEYEPYKENIIIYDLKKENLFDINSISFGSITNSNGVINTTGISNTSIENNTVSFVASSNYKGIISDYINVESLKDYIVKANSDYNSMFYIAYNYDVDKNYLGYSTGKTTQPYKFTTLENAKYVRVVLEVATYTENTIVNVSDIKIYEGTGTDDYYELVSINDIKDELDEATGVLTKRIGKAIFNGSENWSFTTNGNAYYISNWASSNNAKAPTDYDEKSNSLSNYFVNASRAEIYTISNGFGISNSGAFNIKNENYTSGVIDDFKTWLSNNPVTVYYVLAEPETIQLEPTNIELFKGTNNIYTLDDLEPNMNITYLTDSKLNSQYATKSELKVAENSIKASVSGEITELDKKTEASLELKVDRNDNDQIVSMINASAEEINLKANRFSMESDKSRIDKDGTVKFEGGTIGGFEITKHKLSTTVSQTYGPFNDNDLQIVQQVTLGQIAVTQELLDKYDIDGNGILDISDLLSIQRIILGTDSGEHNGSIAINSNNYSHPLETYSNGILHNKIGVEGVYFKKIGGNKAILVNDETGEAQIRIEDRTNNKTCVIKATTDIREMDSGICNLSSTDILFIPFNKTFEYVPNVVITPYTTTTGVIAPKVRSISNTGFEATIGGSGFSNVQCCWIAIG